MASGWDTLGFEPTGSAPDADELVTSLAWEPMLLLSPQQSDDAVMTASSEVGSLTVANLQTRQPAKKWRSASAPAYVDIVFNEGIMADTLAFIGHEQSAAFLMRVKAGLALTDIENDIIAFDTGWQSGWPITGKPNVKDWPVWTSLLRFVPPLGSRYWRVEFADAGLGYITGGRLMLAQAWRPRINFTVDGTSLSFDSRDVQTITPYSRTFTDKRTASPPRIFEVSCYALSKREAFDGIYEIQRLRGLWGDVVCCLYPNDTTDFHRLVMQGVFTNSAAYTIPPVFNEDGKPMFGAAIKMRELI